MSDRELLELAAKAAGVVGEYSAQWNGILVKVHVLQEGDGLTVWNPMTNDGDALRLASVLDLVIDIDQGERWTCVQYESGFEDKEELIGHGHDACEATRHAIVRAATEIGRAMI